MSDCELNNKKVPLIDHLAELRKRLIFCFAGLIIAFFTFYFIADNIFNFLVRPLAQATEGQLDRRMIFTGLHEAFLTQVRVAFFSAFSVTFPVIAIQGWRFIAPGLYQHEKKIFISFIIATPVLFLLGAGQQRENDSFNQRAHLLARKRTPGGGGRSRTTPPSRGKWPSGCTPELVSRSAVYGLLE